MIRRPPKSTLSSSSAASDVYKRQTQMFSPVFNWCPKGSSAVWNSFFLVLETLTEYGVHIVTPALDKITTELVPAIQQGLIHPAWVELLFIKGLRHGNTGVRKVTLKALWATEMSVLLSFSPEMICQGALETAVDGRLATEVDKIVLPTNFLEVVSRSFEDIPISTVTPIVNGIITFYTAYITAVANQQVSQAAADLPPPEELITLMLLTISETSPRFSLSLIHISEPTRLLSISYAVFCLKKKKSERSVSLLRFTLSYACLLYTSPSPRDS
eukprot:TRINITY_DN26905_c0_g1_i1.p1 TRINITY_DN26905_c0_g1~~TRINITY_DN26905_c0_g1_i1.p1  ORF type:complete len:272 (+),score=58.36 TRINITY_DN26905_c0_g1_i1:83-898(+)